MQASREERAMERGIAEVLTGFVSSCPNLSMPREITSYTPVYCRRVPNV